MMDCSSIWTDNDFSECFRQRHVMSTIDLRWLMADAWCRYLSAGIPLIFICVSVSLLLFAYSYSILRTLWRGYHRWRAAEYVPVEEEEDLDSDDEVFVDDGGDEREDADSEATLVHSLPQDTKVVITEDKPAFGWAWVGSEVGLLLGQVGLSIFSIVKGEGWRSIAAVGYIQWMYLLIIALLRFIGTKRTKQLWTHSTIIYILYWPIAFLLLRSAILKGDKLGLGIQIANMCLVSGLCLLVLTSRAGNRPVRLVSTNGLEPTTEQTASLLSLATFSWVDPVIMKGWSKSLTAKDVWDLIEDDQAPNALKAFRNAKSTLKSVSIAWGLIRYFDSMLWAQGLWAVGFALFTFLPTVLLRQILRYVEDPGSQSREAAWLYVIGLFLSSFFSTIANCQALWLGRRICLRLRAIVVGEIYAKALRRRDVALKGGETMEGNISAATNEVEDTITATQANNGAIINLMAVDTFKVSEISAYLHYLMAGVPVELAIAIGLLYNLLGPSALIGILVMVLIFPAQYLITRRFNVVQAKLMRATDKRVTRLDEVLQSIRIIKFFAWEDRFTELVNEARTEELVWLRERLILWASYAVVWYGFPVLVSLATFTSYTQWFGHNLTASTAFTALSLFVILKHPIDQLADMITNVIQSKVSLNRVDEFLREEETEKYVTAVKRRKSSVMSGDTARFEHATFTWASRTEIKREGTDDPNSIAHLAFQLRDIHIEFPPNALTLITGPTGSGKTSLLMALLGELTLLRGSVYLPCVPREEILLDPEIGLTQTVAYCAQQAWLLNDTIKNNILFAAPYNKHRYNAVIKATALEKDLEILEAGDETEVGEKGITMSGGQKQRISLARALYSSAKFILMDDCLSAVDSHTAQWIYQFGIAGELMEGRTRILVTHNVALTLPAAKHVVVMDNGRIKNQGPPEKVLRHKAFGDETDSIRQSLLRSEANTPLSGSAAPSRVASNVNVRFANGNGEEERHGRENDADADNVTTEALEAQKDMERKRRAGKLITEEELAVGSVDWKVYRMYFESFGGWWFWPCVIVAFLGQQGLQVFQNYWVRAWAASYGTNGANVAWHRDTFSGSTFSGNQQSIWGQSSVYGYPQMGVMNETVHIDGLGDAIKGKSDMFYIVGYSVIGVIYIIFSFFRSMIVMWGGLTASRLIFRNLLEHVMRATLRFFDTTPIGRIMNRFSKDMETIDQETPWILISLFSDLLSVTTIVLLISFITPGFLIPGVVIVIIFAFIGTAYLRSSVDLKRLESVSRSPIFQHFGETLNGVSTIRAYGDEQRFIRENLRKINDNNRPFILLWGTNRWLSIRVETAGALVSLFAGAFILLNIDKLDAGLAGLSLTYAITFTEHILWVVRLYSLNEMNMNSVERVRSYTQVEIEAARRSPEGNEPPPSWPERGAIKVENLTLRYAPNLAAVIRDVSFDVEPGAKVAVVGRTGAGKSTMATAFFRFLEADSGRIVIDDIDIAKIGLDELRTKLAIIPQDPTLFKGSLRFNLDPYGEHVDATIYAALSRVHLISVSEQENTRTDDEALINQNIFLNLDTEVAEHGGNLSQGQRQLMCLARALLKAPRVIIMDEATASIDYATDTKIQMTIRQEFVDSTILTIAHRLRSIIDFDKVLVLDKGEVKEYDHPHVLLQRGESIFRSMVEQSGEMEILVELAREAWKKALLVDLE